MSTTLLAIGSPRCFCFLLTPPDSHVTCRGDPAWGTVRSNAQNPVSNDGMINLCHFCNALPVPAHVKKPDIVAIHGSVCVDIQVSDFRFKTWARGGNVFIRVGCVPGCDSGRTRCKGTLLLIRGNGGGRDCLWVLVGGRRTGTGREVRVYPISGPKAHEGNSRVLRRIVRQLRRLQILHKGLQDGRVDVVFSTNGGNRLLKSSGILHNRRDHAIQDSGGSGGFRGVYWSLMENRRPGTSGKVASSSFQRCIIWA